MTAATTTRSAYPVPVDELLPRALDMGIDAGEIPSRNRLMQELRIGPVKANAIRQALASVDFDWGLARELLTDPSETSTGARATICADVLSRLAPLAADDPDDTPPVLYAVPNPEPTPDAVPDPLPDTAPEVEAYPGTDPAGAPMPEVTIAEPSAQVAPVAYPGTDPAPVPVARVRPVRSWPVLLLALPAFVAIWSGWVGLGELTGFGVVHPLPGIFPNFAINTAITLPIGVETYAAYALRAWLSGRTTDRARRFAKWSAIGSLFLGSLGQITYHLMSPTGPNAAPWPITTAVACLPVLVLGMGAALAHLQHADEKEN